jgi:hypothetical protein
MSSCLHISSNLLHKEQSPQIFHLGKHLIKGRKQLKLPPITQRSRHQSKRRYSGTSNLLIMEVQLLLSALHQLATLH